MPALFIDDQRDSLRNLGSALAAIPGAYATGKDSRLRGQLADQQILGMKGGEQRAQEEAERAKLLFGEGQPIRDAAADEARVKSANAALLPFLQGLPSVMRPVAVGPTGLPVEPGSEVRSWDKGEVQNPAPARPPSPLVAPEIQPAVVPPSPLYGVDVPSAVKAAASDPKMRFLSPEALHAGLTTLSRNMAPAGVVPYDPAMQAKFAELGVNIPAEPRGGMDLSPAIREVQRLSAAATARGVDAAQQKLSNDRLNAMSALLTASAGAQSAQATAFKTMREASGNYADDETYKAATTALTDISNNGTLVRRARVTGADILARLEEAKATKQPLAELLPALLPGLNQLASSMVQINRVKPMRAAAGDTEAAESLSAANNLFGKIHSLEEWAAKNPHDIEWSINAIVRAGYNVQQA